MIRNFNGKCNLTHNLLLTNKQVWRFPKALIHANNSSANIKLLKSQLNKIGQPGGFLGRIFGPLLKTGFPLMKNLLKSFAKGVLIPLRLAAAAAATDASIKKKKKK